MSSVSSSTSVAAQLAQATQTPQRAHHGHRPHPGGGDFKAAFASAAQASGVDPSKVDDLQKQIDEAVKNARANGGNDRDAMKNAVDGVLKANNVDPAKFHEAMKSYMEAHRPGKAQQQPLPQLDGQTDASSDGLPIVPGTLDKVA